MIREHRYTRLIRNAVHCRLLLLFAARHKAILIFLVRKGPAIAIARLVVRAVHFEELQMWPLPQTGTY
jgi:hypothetical protein